MANNDSLGPVGGAQRPVETPQTPVAAKMPPIDDGNIQIAEGDALALFIARRGNMLGDDKKLKYDMEDEITAGCLITKDGEVVHGGVKEAMGS